MQIRRLIYNNCLSLVLVSTSFLVPVLLKTGKEEMHNGKERLLFWLIGQDSWQAGLVYLN